MTIVKCIDGHPNTPLPEGVNCFTDSELDEYFSQVIMYSYVKSSFIDFEEYGEPIKSTITLVNNLKIEPSNFIVHDLLLYETNIANLQDNVI